MLVQERPDESGRGTTEDGIVMLQMQRIELDGDGLFASSRRLHASREHVYPPGIAGGVGFIEPHGLLRLAVAVVHQCVGDRERGAEARLERSVETQPRCGDDGRVVLRVLDLAMKPITDGLPGNLPGVISGGDR